MEDNSHDLKQSFAQSSRAAFGDTSGLRIEIARLEKWSVNAGKANKRFFVCEARHVTDFGNELRAEYRSNAV